MTDDVRLIDDSQRRVQSLNWERRKKALLTGFVAGLIVAEVWGVIRP